MPARSSHRVRRLAVLVLAAAVVVGSCSNDTPTKLVDGPTTVASEGALRVSPEPVWIAADATSSVVALYASPGVPDPGGRTMTNPTSFDMPLVFGVVEQDGNWVKVQIPARPNGATAWVRSSDVSLRTVEYRVTVSLGSHRLVVYKGNREVLRAPVAIGTTRTPTPVGRFYIDAKVRLTDPTGAYGAGQLSLAAYSDVITSFGGGPGQVGIHGTNQPSLIGSDVSNGCIRVTDDIVLKLLSTLPTGTPVEVVAA